LHVDFDLKLNLEKNTLKHRKLIVIGLVSVLVIGAVFLLARAHHHSKYGCYGHKPHHGWHHQGPRTGYWGPQGGWGRHAPRVLFRLERHMSSLALSKEQRNQVYAVLDEARPVLRNLHLEMGDNRRALMQLSLAAEKYSQQLNELATKQAELKKNLIVKIGDVKSQAFALLDEQQQASFLNRQEDFRQGPFWNRPEHRRSCW